MEVRAFRALMLVALVLTVAHELITAVGDPSWSLLGAANVRQGALFATGIVVTLCIVALIGFVGMYTLKSWGRTVALVATLAGLVLWAVGLSLAAQAGAMPQANPSSVLDHIAALCWGGALSLAYFSPLRARFGANNSFKPKPLRGSA